MSERRQVVMLFAERQDLINPQVRGGKGAILAEMAREGIPVPPGFTVSTTAARAFNQQAVLPKRLVWQLKRGITGVERLTGKRFGDPANPLLVSVRSGAAISMPGMMDTILNLGLNPDSVRGLAERVGEKTAFDCYRRFLAMFGEIVCGTEARLFQDFYRDMAKAAGGELRPQHLNELCELYHELIRETTGGLPVPDNPWVQLEYAIRGVFCSWNNERAITYRKLQDIPDWWGTAVNVQAMVLGNSGDTSCTGVVFSRNVSTGETGLYGEFLVNAQGEDVVAGALTPLPIAVMKDWNAKAYQELEHYAALLEDRYGDVVDVEFTVEEGKLFILQSRIAKRTPQAAITIAVHQVWEGRLSKAEALSTITEEQYGSVQKPDFSDEAGVGARIFAKGLAASTGAANGVAVFSAAKAREWARSGKRVILFRPETSPDDLAGMIAAEAVVTASGGATCHAAVVARSIGKPAVVGASELWFSSANSTSSNIRVISNSVIICEGDEVSVDGRRGTVYLGHLPLSNTRTKKEINLFMRWAEKAEVYRIKPAIGFDWIGKQVCMNQVLNDFYLTDAMANAAADTELATDAARLRNHCHKEAAELLACYLAVAIAGELRHLYDSPSLLVSASAEIKTFRDKFGLFPELRGTRAEAQQSVLARLSQATAAELREFFRLAESAFNQPGWKNGFGGKAWARISHAPLKFLLGNLNHTLFVDHVFDLRHNGNCLFDKHEMVRAKTSEMALQVQLEQKKEARNLNELRHKLFTHSWKCSPEVDEFWQKGESAGFWTSYGGVGRGRRAS